MTNQYTPTNINAPRQPARTISSDTSLTLDDGFIIVDSSGGPVTVTLPDAEQIPNWSISIKCPDAATNNVTIQGLGGQTIDGAGSLVISDDDRATTVITNGSDWSIIATNGGGGGGGGGGRLVTNANPTFTSTGPGTASYSPPIDEQFQVLDLGGLTSLSVTLPSIPAGVGFQGGQIGVIFPLGNPNVSVQFTPGAGDFIINPITGAPGLAGAPFTITAGDVGGYAVIVWEGAWDSNLGEGYWVFDYNTSVAGDWASVLAKGNISGGTDPFVTEPDRMLYTFDSIGSAGTWITGRTDVFLSGGLNSIVNIGDAIAECDTASNVSNTVTINAEGWVRRSNGGSVTQQTFIIHQIWSLNAASSVIQTIQLNGNASFPPAGPLSNYRITLGVDTSGTVNSLYLKIKEGVVSGESIQVQARVAVERNYGPPPS